MNLSQEILRFLQITTLNESNKDHFTRAVCATNPAIFHNEFIWPCIALIRSESCQAPTTVAFHFKTLKLRPHPRLITVN